MFCFSKIKNYFYVDDKFNKLYFNINRKGPSKIYNYVSNLMKK